MATKESLKNRSKESSEEEFKPKQEPKGKIKDEASKKAMDKARKYMEKFWANGSAANHMRSEMDYLLSNFEHDNGKQYALDEAKRNVEKWKRVGFLDQYGNELRDEKLAYFNRMIEYMEKNM